MVESSERGRTRPIVHVGARLASPWKCWNDVSLAAGEIAKAADVCSTVGSGMTCGAGIGGKERKW